MKTFSSCCNGWTEKKMLKIIIAMIVVIWEIYISGIALFFTNKHKLTECELIHMEYFTLSSVLIYYWRLFNM